MKSTKMFALVLSAMLLLSACGTSTTPSPEASPAQDQPTASGESNAQTSQGETSGEGTSAGSGGYFPKYDPPIALTTHHVVSTTTLFRGNDTVEDNAWTRWQKEHFGIEWKVAWTSPDGTTNQQKLDLAFASGDLPDVISPTPTQLSKYVQGGLIAPLDDLIESSFSPLVKWAIDDAITQTQGAFFMPATINGSIYAMPVMSDTIIFWNNGFIREDILEELGAKKPETLDELETLFAAYKGKYPNNYPFAMDNELAATQIVAAPYKASKSQNGKGHWVELAGGSVGYGSIQPEAKQMLGKMAEWYQKGYIDPEFVVKNGEKMREDVIAGRFLTYYGSWASIASPFTPLWSNIPEANPTIMNFLKGEDGQTRVYDKTWFEGLKAITTSCEHPEAPFLLLNENWDSAYRNDLELREKMSSEYGYEFKYPVTEIRQAINVDEIAAEYPQATEPKELWTYDYPDDVQGYSYFNDFFTHWSRVFGFTGAPVSVLNRDLKSMAEAKRANDDSLMTTEGSIMAYQWNNTTPNMLSNWAITELYWSDFEKSGNYVADAYAGATTELMSEKMAYLNKLELETFTRIIMGTQPLDSFDEFVNNWNSNGGAEITAQVNEWYQNNK